MVTGDGQPTPCIAAILLCCMLGVPGQDDEGSRGPAEVGVSSDEDDTDDGEEERATSPPPSLRGCSWTMDS